MDLGQAVEELAQIQAEIGRLRDREAELRALFLRGPVRVEGARHVVEVEEYRCNLFDRARLPEEVLTNPAYYRVSHRKEVIVTERPDPQIRATG